MDDRKAALELLGCLLSLPLDLTAVPRSRSAVPIDPVRLAERLSACNIETLDPTNPDDLVHLESIAAIFTDLIDNGLSKSTNAPADVINCIVGFVKVKNGF